MANIIKAPFKAIKVVTFGVGMPKQNLKLGISIEDFGVRLAQIRKSRGMTQRELSEKTGISQRMIAYYEKRVRKMPATLLPVLAKALRVSVDELLGLKKTDLADPEHASLWRRLKKAERLSKQEQKALLHYLNTMLRAKSVTKTG